MSAVQKVNLLKTWVLVVVLCVSGGCVRASYNNLIAENARQNQLPQIELSNLEGTDYLFPRDLSSDLNLFVFGFAHEQKDLVQAWVDAATGLKEAHADLSIYKVPVIDNSNAALRMIIRNGMRAGTASQELKMTLPLFVNSERFRQSLGLHDQTKPAAILFDRNGRVLWHSEDEKNEASLAALRSALSQYGKFS